MNGSTGTPRPDREPDERISEQLWDDFLGYPREDDSELPDSAPGSGPTLSEDWIRAVAARAASPRPGARSPRQRGAILGATARRVAAVLVLAVLAGLAAATLHRWRGENVLQHLSFAAAFEHELAPTSVLNDRRLAQSIIQLWIIRTAKAAHAASDGPTVALLQEIAGEMPVLSVATACQPPGPGRSIEAIYDQLVRSVPLSDPDRQRLAGMIRAGVRAMSVARRIVGALPETDDTRLFLRETRTQLGRIEKALRG